MCNDAKSTQCGNSYVTAYKAVNKAVKNQILVDPFTFGDFVYNKGDFYFQKEGEYPLKLDKEKCVKDPALGQAFLDAIGSVLEDIDNNVIPEKDQDLVKECKELYNQFNAFKVKLKDRGYGLRLKRKDEWEIYPLNEEEEPAEGEHDDPEKGNDNE